MATQIYRTPQRRDDEISFSVEGELLTINGVDYDLSGITDPETLDNEIVITFDFISVATHWCFEFFNDASNKCDHLCRPVICFASECKRCT